MHSSKTQTTDQGENSMDTESRETGEPLVRVHLLASERRYGWLRERTVRLLPKVQAQVEEECTLPALVDIHLTGRWHVVRRLGAEALADPGPWVRPVPGSQHVHVYLDVRAARAFHHGSSIAWGAHMVNALTVAAMMTEPDRCWLLEPWMPQRSHWSPGMLTDLRLARREAEWEAGLLAAEVWRARHAWGSDIPGRARQLLDTLAAGVIEDDRPRGTRMAKSLTLSVWAEATIQRLYDASAPESADLGPAGLAGLKTLIGEYGTDAGIDGEGIEADRHRRLCAAAWCDFMALIGTQRTGIEDGAWHDDAVLLGWHLRDFDTRHATSRGEMPAGHLGWEGSSARDYTRQEWAAAHGAAVQE